jgi:hypothetical protein
MIMKPEICSNGSNGSNGPIIVQWNFTCPLDPMEKISCPSENYLSIGSNGKIISKSIDI